MLWRRFGLSFYAASDEGVFPDDILDARLDREAESLADWQRTAAQFLQLRDLHAWLHDQHLCYAVNRQVCAPFISAKGRYVDGTQEGNLYTQWTDLVVVMGVQEEFGRQDKGVSDKALATY